MHLAATLAILLSFVFGNAPCARNICSFRSNQYFTHDDKGLAWLPRPPS